MRNAIAASIFWGYVTALLGRFFGVLLAKRSRERGSASGVIGGGPKREKKTKKEKKRQKKRKSKRKEVKR